MKSLKLFFSTLLFATFFLASAVFAQEDPTRMLNSIADQMIQLLQSHKATLRSNPTLVFSFANQLIVPHADIPEMSRRVLPPQVWNQATPAQHEQFEKEFTTLLVRTYASALAEYKDETIKFYPVRGGYEGKTNVKVDSTIIRSEGPSIPVSYRLVLRGSEWRLYDLIVEGVSLIESFRSQFAEQLSQGNMESLIQRLAQHNRENNGEQ